MKYFLLLLSTFVAVFSANSAIILPNLFTDHAVLQRSNRTALWGTAAPGESLSITLGSSALAQTVADDRGKWRVDLNLVDSPSGPFELTVKGKDETVVVHDVAVGDVWLCSGQSNMEFKLSQTIGAPEEIARSTNPLLRCFLPKRQAVSVPPENMQGRWIVAGPEASGMFSGVAYYFAKTVQAAIPGPIGLIDTSWGGTPAEAWMSSEGLDRDPALKARKDTILAERPQADENLKRFSTDFKRWAEQYHREDHSSASPADFAAPEIVTAGWKNVTLPGTLSPAGLPDSGVIWLRREVEVPANRAGTYLPLLLGTLHDFETVYWNGTKIGETTPAMSTSMNPDLTSTTNRRYDVPGTLAKPGKNVLAIRLFSPGGSAGINATRFTAGWNIPLGGEWQAKVESEFSPLSVEAKSSYPQRPPWPAMPHYTATYLSNGMVRPIAGLSLRGVIWYQGEANVGRAHQYRTTFPLLIQDWRAQFHNADLPFYFCQLANFQSKKSTPGESAWAELRDAQAQALSLPHTGMAVLIDIGEEEDIHARNKKDAGQRLAAVALAKTYNSKTSFAGPTYESSESRGDKIALRFAQADGGLVARPLPETYQPKSSYAATKPLMRYRPGSELQGFAVCGADHAWKWADAKIEGDTVIVWSAEVQEPKFVRYAWADNPTCNLYNGAGFPAVPFRTDTFPDSTAHAKY